MNAPGHPVRGTARLKPGRKRLVPLAAAGLWASGAAWLVFHYLLRTK